MPAELAVGANLARHTCNFAGERIKLIHHRVDGVLQLQNFPLHVYGDLSGEVPISYGSGHLRNISDLCGKITGHRVDAVGQILPSACNPPHFGLTSKFAFSTHFASHAGYFGCKRAKLIDHRVDSIFQLQNLAANIDSDFPGKIALGDCSSHFSDITNLVSQVPRHEIDVVRQILPCSRNTFHLGLTAKLPLRPNLTGNTRNFRSK